MSPSETPLVKLIVPLTVKGLRKTPPSRAPLSEIGAPETEGLWIYFAQQENGGPIKIGSARRIYGRLSELQVGNPSRLCLVGYFAIETRAIEADVHQRFDHLRVRGEWFAAERELVAFVTSLPRDGSGPAVPR